MSDGCGGIPADVFLNILLRIPPSPRRRLRLVCRHWRDAIDERAPEPRAFVKVLSFHIKGGRSHAYVFDDLTAGRSRELDLEDSGVDSYDGVNSPRVSMIIGTCNGLLCLGRKRGDIAVTNPVIGETIAVDPPPMSRYRDMTTYSFGYHPATGQYKIVHFPCNNQRSDLAAVHVFTLGDGTWQWREVPAPPGSSCHLGFGLTTVHGVTYWATKNGQRIMSFDLKDERIANVDAPPVPAPQPSASCRPSCHLTDLGGRLGLVVCDLPDEFKRSKTEVWVLEDGMWVKRYTMLAHGVYPRQEIALPHVAHDEHVLTTCKLWGYSSDETTLEAHRPRQERKMRPCGMVRVGAPRPETTVGVYDV
ncbi:unnamed protein product [Urochloa decumbens]|uniref:F-box domain-containing protein n=1 Tax=Urochloa decumbens TaxID=240449 RepID=A0ABC8WE90_9POAL